MIAVDTNILVYAHRKDSSFHLPALKFVRSLAEGRKLWCIPWPCVHEFLSVVTHPRIYAPPTPIDDALDQVDAWLTSPSVRTIGESERYWSTARNIIAKSQITGARVHNARVASICLASGVTVLNTADRDFSRFPGLVTENPLVSA